eukprot:scaffold86792_cov45-Prasinocladus_malaysianus.AAC.2
MSTPRSRQVSITVLMLPDLAAGAEAQAGLWVGWLGVLDGAGAGLGAGVEALMGTGACLGPGSEALVGSKAGAGLRAVPSGWLERPSAGVDAFSAGAACLEDCWVNAGVAVEMAPIESLRPPGPLTTTWALLPVKPKLLTPTSAAGPKGCAEEVTSWRREPFIASATIGLI